MLESIVAQLKESKEEKSDVYCTKMNIPYQELSLKVEPFGEVAFPITARTAKSLIVEAEPAQYGHKDKTLYDRKVRDTWEVPKNRIQTNPEWDGQLQQAITKIQKDLNLSEDGTLTADLHNLLIYMPGQFFKAHQDSEKAQGMIATLIVILPSEFEGGEFVIEQHGDKKVYEFAAETDKSLTLIAFYTDCYHEVKEVKCGYRLALTYNLFFKASSKPILTKKNMGLEQAVQNYFSQASERESGSGAPRLPWLVYLLDHEYTRSSLDWNSLRGIDRERMSELLACADDLDLTAHLALADVHETWSAEGNDDWRESYWESQYQLTELLQDEIILRHWIARSGEKFEERDQHVPRQMVCWTKAADQFKPFQSEYEGYMGNYGNTLDRWYHRAAIILWKKKFDLIHLFSCDKVEALRVISRILMEDKNRGHQAVHEILPYWPADMSRYIDPALVFDFAVLVQDAELASALVKTLGMSSLKKQNLSQVMELVELYGEDWMIQVLDFWRSRRQWDESDSFLKDLSSLVDTLAKKYPKISHWILKDQCSLLFQSDGRTESRYRQREIRKALPQKLRDVEILLKACRAVDEVEIGDKLVNHLLERPTLYPELDLVNLFLKPNDLSAHALGYLGKRLERQISKPRKDGDWSIQDGVPHHCVDCQELKKFLLSVSTQKLVWPLAKDRRAHIHEIIDAMDIPVTHETIHQGSPHKLVLNKTTDLFVRDKDRIKAIEICLEKLRRRKIPEDS